MFKYVFLPARISAALFPPLLLDLNPSRLVEEPRVVDISVGVGVAVGDGVGDFVAIGVFVGVPLPVGEVIETASVKTVGWGVCPALFDDGFLVNQ